MTDYLRGTVDAWPVLASLLAAVAVLAWLPPPAGRRLARPAASVRPVESRPEPRRLLWPAAGAGVGLLVGWAFLPSAAVALLPVFVVAGGITGHRLGARVPSASSRAIARSRRADLPPVLELMATCLEAGLPLRHTATAVHDAADGPIRDDLARVLHQLDVGIGDRQAWRALAEIPEWQQVARNLARSVDSGTGLVEMLRLAAEDARQAHQADRLERARTVGVRSVLPLMVCYLPAFLALGIVPIVGSAVLGLLA